MNSTRNKDEEEKMKHINILRDACIGTNTIGAYKIFQLSHNIYLGLTKSFPSSLSLFFQLKNRKCNNHSTHTKCIKTTKFGVNVSDFTHFALKLGGFHLCQMSLMRRGVVLYFCIYI